ncbi:MAG: hypothetical protein NVS9B12_05590 [Vulcanimicrobiaceae bacterium]
MGRHLLRSFWVFALVLAGLPSAALADTGPFGSVVNNANVLIKSSAQQAAAQAAADRAKAGGTITVGQVPPVDQQPVGGRQTPIGLPTGFNYTLDVSAAYPFGDIGNGKRWLPGGVDAVASYGFNPKQRIVLNYYELQHYPVGFNTGTRPLYLPSAFPLIPGVNPACVDLTGTTSATCSGQNIDVTTKDRFFLAYFNQLVIFGKGAKAIPLVISPTYVARTSKVAASFTGNDDVVGFVDQTGVPHTDIHTRTAQVKSIAFTLPFLKTPKMFGTITLAPSWLVHTAGVNQENHAQLYQILYLEYNMRPGTKFFFEPQSSRDYLPADRYAQHLSAYFLGASQQVGKVGFIQLVLNSGSPTNYAPYGVSQFNCYALPCATNTVPAVGGLKATQLQIQFGIGSPSVLQF